MAFRRDKMERVVKVAEADEREAAERTGRAQRQLNEQLDRLKELRRYRQEYSERGAASRNTTAAQLKDYQSFLDRLDEAVTSQRQIIHECERTLETQRLRWQGKRQRLESLQKVAERLQKERRLASDRQDQRVADDRHPMAAQFSDPANDES